MLQVCPKDRPAPRMDLISEDTWVLLRQRAAVRRAFFDEGRFRRSVRLQFVLWRWRAATPAGGATRHRLLAAADLLVEAEADGAVGQAFSGVLLRRASGAAAGGVKRDRLDWLRGKADFVAGQAAAGQRAPMWELVRQLAGRKAARGPRPVAVQQAADGRSISRRGELLECWEGLFAAAGCPCGVQARAGRRA
jgi:hypothetical protein